jgi:hypothetical protein
VVYVAGALVVGEVIVLVNDETVRLWSEALFALMCFCMKQCTQATQGNIFYKVSRFLPIESRLNMNIDLYEIHIAFKKGHFQSKSL